MPVISCSKCGYTSDAPLYSKCLKCNTILDKIGSNASGGFKFPIEGAPLKIGAGIFLLIFGYFAVTTLLAWKSERDQKRREAHQMELVKNFDLITFENDPAAFERAKKTMPEKFSVKPPETETLKTALAPLVSQKDRDAYKKDNRLSGTMQQTVSLTPTYNPGRPIGTAGGAVMTDGGVSPSSVKVPVNIYNQVETKISTKNVIKDLKVLDYSYVKGPGNKLYCYIRYELITESFRNSQEIAAYSMPTTSGEKQPLGNKVGENTVIEGAQYELIDGTWVFRGAEITELRMSQEMDDLKTRAKTSAPQ